MMAITTEQDIRDQMDRMNAARDKGDMTTAQAHSTQIRLLLDTHNLAIVLDKRGWMPDARSMKFVDRSRSGGKPMVLPQDLTS